LVPLLELGAVTHTANTGVWRLLRSSVQPSSFHSAAATFHPLGIAALLASSSQLGSTKNYKPNMILATWQLEQVGSYISVS